MISPIRTPVVLLVFNRPGPTARVLEAVAKVRPRTLLVVADGPRPDRPRDAEQCDATRGLFDRVDWPCDIVRNFAPVNIGCSRRVASGITWAFEQVQEAIILEDDCVPHPSFFPFCEELLERYRDDERVMHIAGSTYRRHAIATPYSYFFSLFNGCWGWATWRRAWRHFDAAVTRWDHLRHRSWLADLLEDQRAVEYWRREFEDAHAHQGDASMWDHQWTFACWANSGLSIVPRENLVTNIGCGEDATHMYGGDDPTANLPVAEVAFPLSHPPGVLQLREADRECIREVVLPRLWTPSPLRRLASRVTPQFAKTGARALMSATRAASARLGRRSSGWRWCVGWAALIETATELEDLAF
jgi:hypothetical protein